jgi:hypothetical protein
MTTPSTVTQESANNLACGGTADGWLSTRDAVHMLTADTSTNANANLVSTSFNLVPTGSPTFTSAVGYTGSATAYEATGFTPSTASGKFAVASADMTIDISASNANSQAEMGTINSAVTVFSIIETNVTGSSNNQYSINDTGAALSTSITTTGLFSTDRTAVGARAAYVNAVQTTSDTQSNSGASLPDEAMVVGGLGGPASLSLPGGTANTVSYDDWGSGLTAAQQFFHHYRINATLCTAGLGFSC